MKILSVDDSRVVHSLLRDCFKETEHELVSAMSGQEALDLLSSDQGKDVDLVLLDWEMPEMTGPEVLKELRKKSFSNPIVMLTSKNEPDDILQVMALGVNEYIMKPFTRDLIFEKIEMVVGKKVA